MALTRKKATTLANSVYCAKARLRIAELITTGILAVSSRASNWRQTSSPVVPGNWWSSTIN